MGSAGRRCARGGRDCQGRTALFNRRSDKRRWRVSPAYSLNAQIEATAESKRLPLRDEIARSRDSGIGDQISDDCVGQRVVAFPGRARLRVCPGASALSRREESWILSPLHRGRAMAPFEAGLDTLVRWVPHGNDVDIL